MNRLVYLILKTLIVFVLPCSVTISATCNCNDIKFIENPDSNCKTMCTDSYNNQKKWTHPAFAEYEKIMIDEKHLFKQLKQPRKANTRYFRNEKSKNDNMLPISRYEEIRDNLIAATLDGDICTNIIEELVDKTCVYHPHNIGCDSILFYAVKHNHPKMVKELLKLENIDLNAKNLLKSTALIEAAKEGHIEVVEVLVAQEGIDLNAKCVSGNTALIEAAKEGHTKAVEVLVAQEGIDLNAKGGGQINTALIEAAKNGRVEVIEVLVAQEGIDLNAKGGEQRNTALIEAAKNGRVEVVEVLVAQEGIDLNAKDYSGNNFLYYLSEKKTIENPQILSLSLRNGLSLHENYSVEDEDIWHAALDELSEEEREKVLAERSWFGYINEKLVHLTEAGLPPLLNYLDHRNTLDATYYGQAGNTITEGEQPSFLRSIINKFTATADSDSKVLNIYKLQANYILKQKPIASTNPGTLILPIDTLKHIGSYMMHPNQESAEINYINTNYNHRWEKSPTWKNALILPYTYLCSKLNNNLDFSALSPLGNSHVLWEEIKSPSKLLTRTKDTIIGIGYDIGNDIWYILGYTDIDSE